MNTTLHKRVQCSAHPVWRHLGGTTQKADCDVTIGNNCFSISIKNHENTGTFDWINTSKFAEFNPELGASIIFRSMYSHRSHNRLGFYNSDLTTTEMIIFKK
jgi:hypothetical protein